MMLATGRGLVWILCAGVMGAGCVDATQPAPSTGAVSSTVTPSLAPDYASSPSPQRRRSPVTARPGWLGTRVLPEGPEGFGIATRTPRVLRDRRFATVDVLPPPHDDRFRARIRPVPAGVAARSTWRPRCPVALADLSYLTMTFWGFDRRPHTGEMIVHSSVASGVVEVFRELHRISFPIEEMRVASLREQRRWIHASTGDTNVTSSLECRRATLGSSWSQHAYGLAIDINPFHNPYMDGDLVAPELARAYTNRNWRRPGMIFEGDAVTRAFNAIGWGWGGRWNSIKDWMHFSLHGN